MIEHLSHLAHNQHGEWDALRALLADPVAIVTYLRAYLAPLLGRIRP